MDLASQILVCITVAGACAGIVRLVRLPLPLVQAAAGALLAWPLGMDLPLDPHAFLLVLIPPLLFIDGWRIPKREFRANRTAIMMMAFGLVALTVITVGLLIDWLVPAIPRPVAFAIAAALSPTDAVAVSGITGRTPVPARLMTILQGEALFNDASGLVSMRLAVAAMVTGAFSWFDAIGSFVVVAAGGVAIGIALAWLFVRVVRVVLGRDDDAGPRILLLMMFPYAAYLAAEELHLSGILAAVSAGMVARRFELVDAGHRSTRLQGAAVLHMTELALNGLVFVLLGLQLPGIVGEATAIAKQAEISVAALALDIGIVTIALVAVRFAWVWLSMRVTIFRARSRGVPAVAPPIKLIVATALAGVRGAVTLAAALTLPLTLADGSAFPAREVAIFVCASVIVIWLVAASAGLPMLLRGVALPVDDTAPERRARVRSVLAEAAIAAVETELATREVPPEIADRVLDVYRARLGDPSDVVAEQPGLQRELRVVAIRAERAKLVALSAAHEIDDEVFNATLRELDLVEEAFAPRDPR